MKRLGQFITEVKSEHAYKEAIAKGLKYKGFGYWEDPNTGTTAFKTVDDRLLPVSGEEEQGGQDMKQDMQAFPGGGPEKVGDMSTGDQMAQTRKTAGLEPAVPGSQVKGAPEPGEELVPRDIDWEPGPEGSTCVDSDDPPGIIPDDVYVGRSNNMKWTAGPDGTNYANIDYGMWLRRLRENDLSTFMNRIKLMEAIPHIKRQ